MAIKIVLTGLVAIVWYLLFMGNLMAAGRTAARRSARSGLPLAEARRRAMPLAVGWAVVLSALAVIALVRIW